jgi:chromosome segregation ATPase
MLDVTILDQIKDGVTTFVAVLTASGLGFLAARRKISKDGLELTKDRSEENLIKQLEGDRARLREENLELGIRANKAELERTEAIIKMNQLSINVDSLTGQIKLLQQLVETLGCTLDDTRDELHKYMEENKKLSVMIEELKKNVPTT